MPLPAPFKLERYFAQYEFKAKYLLSPSDCESLALNELLHLANADGLRLWNDLGLGYTESPGHPVLRKEIARMYQTIPPDQIVVAAPEELIYIALNTLLKPGDHAVCISPAYQSLYEIARGIGCEVTPWAVKVVNGEWRLDLNQLEAAITDRTRLIVVNFPHNPTGYLPTRGELEATLQLARRHDLFVFCDEMYRLLEYDAASRLPPVCDLYERGISLSGLSKTFALPGLRIGWLATQNRSLPEEWLTFKDYTTICSSAPSEILAIIALRAADLITARNLQIIQSNLHTAEQFCAGHRSLFQWLRPRAGSIAFPRWLGSEPIERLCQSAVDERGVMVVPGSIFDYPPQLHYLSQHFRVGLGRRNFPEALEQFGAHVRESS